MISNCKKAANFQYADGCPVAALASSCTNGGLIKSYLRLLVQNDAIFLSFVVN